MENYCIAWKKRVNFKEDTYDEFIKDNPNFQNAFYLQKIDGMLGILIYEKGKECFFQTTTGAEIRNLPVLEDYKNSLSRFNNIQSIKIVGELIAKKGNNLLPWGESQSILKTLSRSNTDLVHHYCYDIYELNGKKIDFKQSITFLESMISKEFKHIDIPSYSYGGLIILKLMYKKYVSTNITGIEGIVIRTDRKNFKIKPFFTLDLVVIGAGNVNMVTWEREQISYLIPAFVDKNKNFRITSNIGTGFDFATRNYFYDYVQKNKTMDQDIKGNFFVKPELIIEVKFLRYHVNDMDCYSYKNGVYTKIGKKESVTLINPRFNRIRIDKKINDFDVRLNQIPEL